VRAVVHRLRAHFKHAVGADEPAWRVAVAWAVGVTIALSPLVGLHTAIGLLAALILRLNKPDVLLGTIVINPWTMPVYCPAATVLGAWITGIRIPRSSMPEPFELLDVNFWRSDHELMRALLITWGTGAAVCCVIGGLVSFFLLRRLVEVHRRRLRQAAVEAES
jgi:uncharacterized protein (DUF2062 family)